MNEQVLEKQKNISLPEVKIAKLDKVKTNTSKNIVPNRFSVRGMRRHGGIITSRNPRVGF